MQSINLLLGIWIGLLILPLWLLGLTILFIKQLSDDPKDVNKPYFFTIIEPGRAKAVLRGGKVVRYLMNWAGNRFSRVGDDKEADIHWDVEPGDDHVPMLTPVPFSLVKFLLWPVFARQVFGWYVSMVFRYTGHVFVGIWPFQTLHLYKFTRKVQMKDELDRPMTDKEDGLPILIDSEESTDHVRVRPFAWQVDGQAGETREGLKIGIRGQANVRIINPQRAMFGADRWYVVLTSTILRTLASNIRTMSIDQVLLAEVLQKDKLAKDVMTEANERLKPFGLVIDEYQILNFEAKLTPEDQTALTAKWRAEKKKEAAKIEGEGRGQGRAAEITAVADAIRRGGEETRRAQELEALIRQASEAGKSGGVVILGGSNSTGGIDAAILAELKKLNSKGGRNA